MYVIHEEEMAAESHVLRLKNTKNNHGELRLDDTTFECVLCVKKFKSKSTLQSHLESPRHLWQINNALEELKFMGIVGVLKDNLAKQCQYLSEIEFDLEEELNSSEEGYCTDENKMLHTNGTRGEIPHKNEGEKKPEEHRFRRHNTKQERVRRKKMEELKEVYKHMGVSRGSSELYRTMVESYDEFPEVQNESVVKTKLLKRGKSVVEKEALMKRDMVLTELADTERDYVSDLGFIVNEFIPLLESDCISTSLHQSFSSIFGNIEDIYKFHSRIFSEKIEDCLEEPNLLQETFCYHEEDLVTLYTQYCKCKPFADEALEIHEAELETIRKQYLPTRKLSIKDYLVKPVQRLMKYQLLLSSVKSYSTKADLNISSLNLAIEVTERVPKEANDALNVQLIQGYQGYLPTADLIYQDTLNVGIGKCKSKARPMRVFMFEDVVVFTDPIKRNKKLPIYKSVAEGKTMSMGITEIVENDALKFAIWFRKYKSTDIFVCQAETHEAKNTWIQVLTDVIAIQAILHNRVSRYNKTFRDNFNDKNRKRSRSMNSSKIVIEETLRQRLIGHPRLDSMSQKLKTSIEKYVMDEILELDEVTIFKQRHSCSQSIAATLVSKNDMGPVCRPRNCKSLGSMPRTGSREKRPAKEELIDTVTHVSFGVLDPLKLDTE